MDELRKAAEMALEALEELRFANAPFLDEAMEALRTALAQPKREWVGLTDEERAECIQVTAASGDAEQLMAAIEAKLKEKNT